MRVFPEPALAALVGGIGLGVWLDAPLASPLPLLMLALAGLALAAVLRLLRLPAGPVLLAAALLVGVWRAELASGAGEAAPVVTGADAVAVVRITDAPAPAPGGRYRFRATVVDAGDGVPGSVPVGTGLLVYALPPAELTAERAPPYLRYGDIIRVSGRVEVPQAAGDFDYAAWLQGQGIAAILWARETETAETRARARDAGGGYRSSSDRADGDRGYGEPGGRDQADSSLSYSDRAGSSPSYRERAAAALHGVRTALAGAINRALPAPQSGLAQALFLGIRAELPAAVRDDFRTAGMSHLLAISGLHVGIVMALTLGAAQAAAGRGSPAAIIATAAVVWVYAVLSGLAPPVTRAAIMGSLALAQGLAGRGMRGLTALLLAAAAMAVVEPALLGRLSFQLSFMAMAGIMAAMPLNAALTSALTLGRSASDGALARWCGYGARLLAASAVISVATTLATLPLAALHFGAIPLMSVPATILAMPAMSAALVGTALTAAAGLVFPAAATVVGALTGATLEWLMLVAELMPPLLLPAPWFTPGAALASYAGLVGLLLLASSRRLRVRALELRRRRPSWRPGGLAALLAGAAPAALIVAALLAAQAGAARPDGRLHLYILDIGQGDAILVVTPGGRQVLIDGGPDPATTLAALGPLLPPGDRTLDAVIATHLDSDHIGGLLGVLERYRAGVTLQGSVRPEGSALYPQWAALLGGRGQRVAALAAGHRIALDDGVLLETLYPPAGGLPPGVDGSPNNASVVLRLTYGAVSFLLTGDIAGDAEEYLAATAGGRLRSDVLKVSHHGSKSSTTAGFLRAAAPRSAAVSAGRDNSYGHPHAEVMGRLEAAVGAGRVFLTARDGTIEYVSDGVGLWVKTHPGR